MVLTFGLAINGSIFVSWILVRKTNKQTHQKTKKKVPVKKKKSDARCYHQRAVSAHLRRPVKCSFSPCWTDPAHWPRFGESIKYIFKNVFIKWVFEELEIFIIEMILLYLLELNGHTRNTNCTRINGLQLVWQGILLKKNPQMHDKLSKQFNDVH